MAMIRLTPDARQSLTLCSAKRAGLLDVAHLGGRAATTPLLVHQTELDAGLLQHLGGGAGVRRPVERGLAVDEHDGLAADRDVQTLGPGADVRLALRLAFVGGAQDGLVREFLGQPVPQLPAVAVQTLVHHECPRSAHHFDRLGAGLVEVADEKSIGAADLAPAALHAVHIVVGDVLDVQQAFVHRDDVGHERGGRVVLIAGDLGDGAHLAAELVAGGEAVVAVLPPAIDEVRLGLLVVCGPVPIAFGHIRLPFVRAAPSGAPALIDQKRG